MRWRNGSGQQEWLERLFLLMELRGEHGGRIAKDETFALNCIAMAEHGTIPNWTRYDDEKARNVLLQAGKLQQVSKFSMSKDGRRARQFRLMPFRAKPTNSALAPALPCPIMPASFCSAGGA